MLKVFSNVGDAFYWFMFVRIGDSFLFYFLSLLVYAKRKVDDRNYYMSKL